MTAKVDFLGGKPIDQALIAEFQAEFGCILPHSFVELVVAHDGARPSPATFPTPYDAGGRRTIAELGELFAFDPRPDGASSIFEINRELHDVYPGFRIVAQDGGGNLFVLDYRVPSDDPPVFLIMNDFRTGRTLLKVADRFADILSSFVDHEEADRIEDEDTAKAPKSRSPNLP